MTPDLGPTAFDTYTYVRDDGATVSMPSGTVVAPPYWVQQVMARIDELERKLDDMMEANRLWSGR